MNCICILPEEFDGKVASIKGERLEHIRQVLKLKVGDTLKAGVVEGLSGLWRIEAIDHKILEIVNLSERPLVEKIPLHLFLALPRPKVFRRVLGAAIMMGVERVTIFSSFKVEKSYWQSPYLSEDSIRQIQQKAMQQTGDLRSIRVDFEKRFKPFIEDRVPVLGAGRQKVLFHPGGSNGSVVPAVPSVCAIGPEGGFTDYEIEKFISQDFQVGGLGPRILTAETAVVSAITKFV